MDSDENISLEKSSINFPSKKSFNLVVFLPFEVSEEISSFVAFKNSLIVLKLLTMRFLGALVEEDALLLHRDFQLAIDIHNNNTASNFKLSVDQSIVNASDVFQFSRSSE